MTHKILGWGEWISSLYFSLDTAPLFLATGSFLRMRGAHTHPNVLFPSLPSFFLSHPLPTHRVVTTLTSQRETLLRATDSASNTNALAGKARGILMQMAARALTNKILLFVTVLILLGANGVVIYFIIKGR